MKKGILIYGPTRILGRGLIANKQDILYKLFRVGDNKKLVEKVSESIEQEKLNWTFDFDSTESNEEELSVQELDLVVLLPGLEKQFDKGTIPDEKIIQLTTMEYHENDVTRIMDYMKQYGQSSN